MNASGRGVVAASKPDGPGPLRFLVDSSLKKLAQHLRLVGFNTEIFESQSSSADRAREEFRILVLPQDAPSFDESGLRVIRVAAGNLEGAFRGVLETCGALEAARNGLGFMTRCLQCNVKLTSLPFGMAQERLPAEITERYQDFLICTRCERMHWMGDHTDRLRAWLKRTLSP